MNATALFITADYIDDRIRRFCCISTEEAAGVAKIEFKMQAQPKGWKYCHNSIYKNILCGLALVETEYVYICEHDCIYPPEYFTADNVDGYNYSTNVRYLTKRGFIKRQFVKGSLSTLFGRVEDVENGIIGKMDEYKENGSVKFAEPNDGRPFRFANEIIDIRHTSNFTGKRHGTTYSHEEAGRLWAQIERM